MTSTSDWISQRIQEMTTAAKAEERQRIIEMLESFNKDEHQMVLLDGVIALIKGESK